jgi:RNA polymerase sigma factor (sigma-70 family)
LVRAYAATGDPAGFAELVRRHFGLARRAAADVYPAAADDAAQAAFVLLARRAAALADRESVAGWVFETARRLALKARTTAARRARREGQAAAPSPPPDPLDDLTFREVRAVVAGEVAELPDDLRASLVLCYWDGATRAAAAARLGCSVRTLRRRLDEARDRLAARLARRGFSGAAVLAALAGVAAAGRAAAPAALVAAAVAAATGAGRPAAGAAELLRSAGTGVAGWKPAAVAAAVFAAGVGLAVGVAPGGGTAPPTAADSPGPPPRAEAAGRTDRYGDPLPPGAVLRLGTVRFRHGGQLHAAAVSPDGKTIASGGFGRIMLWEAKTGRPLAVLVRDAEQPPDGPADPRGGPPRDGFIFELAFSPDGKWLYSVGSLTADRDEGAVVAWELAARSWKYALTRKGGNPWRRSVAAAPDGTTVAAGGDDGSLWLIDPATRTDRTGGAMKLGRGLGVGGLSFSRDGRRLAVAAGQDVVLVEPATGAELGRLDAGPGTRRVAFAPDGRSVWVGRDGGRSWQNDKRPGTLSRWDVTTGRAVQTLETDPGLLLSLAVSPDGKVLASGGEGTGPYLWDAATGARHDLDAGRKGVRPWVHSLTFTPDGNALVVADTNGRVRVLDVATRKELHVYDEHAGGVLRAALSPDETRIATAGGDGTVRVWDARTGRSVRAWHADERRSVFGVEFTPDGRSVLSHGWDGTVRLWDADTGREVRRYTGPGPMARAALSPDGAIVAATGADGRAIVLSDAATGRRLRECAGHTSFLIRLVYSADGRFVVSAADMHSEGAGKHVVDCSVRVWDAATGEEVRRFDAGRPSHLGVSPDGRVVAAATTSVAAEVAGRHRATIRFWDVVTGRELTDRRLDGGGPVAFSPDGRYLATADRGVRVWEAATGRVVHTVAAGPAETWSLAFSRDGRRLVSAHGDGTVLVWGLTPPPPQSDPGRWWDDLGSADAGAAWRAAGELAARPDEAVAMLKGKLRPVPKADAAATARLIAELDDPRFAVREVAGRELCRRAGAEFPALWSARRAAASAEVRERLDGVLRSAPPAWAGTDPGEVRESRAVAVLEAVDTPAAREVLGRLAGGDPYARLTREAAAAVKRLGAR